MKILLCLAVHLYAGPIAEGTPVTELAAECKAATLDRVRKQIAKCAAEGAERCEVIVSPSKDRITIERKVSTRQ